MRILRQTRNIHSRTDTECKNRLTSIYGTENYTEIKSILVCAGCTLKAAEEMIIELKKENNKALIESSLTKYIFLKLNLKSA